MKTGIWIDTSKAHIVHQSDGESNSITIRSEVDTREREPGKGNESGRFGDQHLEKDDQNRLGDQKARFLQKVIAEIEKSESLVIFGPASMKTELKKAIEEMPQLAAIPVGIETADSMTDNQVVAWVREYFEKKP